MQPVDWPAFIDRQPPPSYGLGMDKVATILATGLFASVGALIGLNVPAGTSSRNAAQAATNFHICHTGGGKNCVVDGDTAWINGVKVRIADIDTPETHPPRCTREAELGNRATRRLAELLSQGSFELVPIERDQDQYGRKLRVIVRGGRSIGDQLVEEGLARTWEGRRRPWC